MANGDRVIVDFGHEAKRILHGISRSLEKLSGPSTVINYADNKPYGVIGNEDPETTEKARLIFRHYYLTDEGVGIVIDALHRAGIMFVDQDAVETRVLSPTWDEIIAVGSLTHNGIVYTVITTSDDSTIKIEAKVATSER